MLSGYGSYISVSCYSCDRTLTAVSQAFPEGVFPPLPVAGPSPRTFLFRLQLFRYVLILFLARSANSGNCRVHESMIACIFSFGCLDIGTILSRFSSTNRRTNIWKITSIQFLIYRRLLLCVKCTCVQD